MFYPLNCPQMSILFFFCSVSALRFNILLWKMVILHQRISFDSSLCHICHSCNRRWWKTAIWTLSSPRGFTPSTNDKRCYPINPTLLSHEPPLYIQPCVMLKRSIRTSCTLVPDSWFFSHKNTELTSASYCYLWNISNKLSNLLSQFGVKEILLNCLLALVLKLLPAFHLKSILCLSRKKALDQFHGKRACTAACWNSLQLPQAVWKWVITLCSLPLALIRLKLVNQADHNNISLKSAQVFWVVFLFLQRL